MTVQERKTYQPTAEEVRRHIVANLKIEGIETTSEQLEELSRKTGTPDGRKRFQR